MSIVEKIEEFVQLLERRNTVPDSGEGYHVAKAIVAYATGLEAIAEQHLIMAESGMSAPSWDKTFASMSSAADIRDFWDLQRPKDAPGASSTASHPPSNRSNVSPAIAPQVEKIAAKRIAT